MNEKERRILITKKVENSEKSISVSELSKEFGVSLVTIRNDLSILEKDGLLTRFHGGAIRNKPHDIKSNLSNFSNKEKEIIAKKAVLRVKDKSTIVIGSGTTTAVFAYYLSKSDKKELTILTNNILAIPYLIANHNFHIIIIGGKYQRDNFSTFSPSLNEAIKEMTIDQMFSGADGYNKKMVTSKNEGVSFSSEISNYANETLILAESFKNGKSFFIPVMSIDKVTEIIDELN